MRLTSVSAQAIGTRVLQRTTHLLDGTKDVNMTKDMFMQSILPIGVLFSGSLILSNTAYLYLSVSYIQMLKVSSPCLSPHFSFYLIFGNRHLHQSLSLLFHGVPVSQSRIVRSA